MALDEDRRGGIAHGTLGSAQKRARREPWCAPREWIRLLHSASNRVFGQREAPSRGFLSLLKPPHFDLHLAHAELLHLAAGGQRKRVNEADVLRDLEVSDLFPAEF